jgi:hypothetical protein
MAVLTFPAKLDDDMLRRRGCVLCEIAQSVAFADGREDPV